MVQNYLKLTPRLNLTYSFSLITNKEKDSIIIRNKVKNDEYLISECIILNNGSFIISLAKDLLDNLPISKRLLKLFI